MEVSYRHSAKVILITLLVILTLMTPIDLSVMSRVDWPVFLILRALVWILSAVLLYKVTRGRLGPKMNAALPWTIWVINTFHLVVDVQFRAGYIIGYYQSVMIWAFLFQISRSQIRWQFVLGLIVMVPAVYFSKAIDAAGLHAFEQDLYIGIIMTNLMALYGHHAINERRAQRQEHYRRFADAGRYTAMLVHDLKGMMATPLVSAAILKNELKDTTNPRIKAVLSGLEESLAYSKDLVSGANRLSSANATPQNPTDMKEIIEAIRTLLKARLRSGAQLVFQGPGSCPPVSTQHNLLFRTLLNVITNSLDAIDDRKIPNPRIEITCEDHRITVWDNAGGFTREALLRLTHEQYVSTREAGSGLGCMIVNDYMEMMGGRVQFSNETRGAETGALVELQFA